jgi:hypothetical protein
MNRIFIASPFKTHKDAEKERFINYARELCRFVLNAGHVPYAPHLIYHQFLDDSNEIERAQGIRAGLAFLFVCQELWFGSDFGITEGMKEEIEHARYGAGIPVKEIRRSKGGQLLIVKGDFDGIIQETQT